MDDLEGIVNLHNNGMQMINSTAEEKRLDPLFPTMDTLMKSLELNEQKIKAIVAFFEFLSGSYLKCLDRIFPQSNVLYSNICNSN